MSWSRRVAIALAAVTVAGVGPASAFAAEETFGTHVSMCAQMSLGQRDNAPEVTCTHDGMTMTFATFGAMVEHMRATA